MLPIINVAAKGLLKVVSNIGYSIGKNIYKATLGKKDSDELIFERYLQTHVSSDDWTAYRLHSLSRRLLQAQQSTLIETYIEECLLIDSQGL